MTDNTDGAHSCGPHCERVPCLKRKISELEEAAMANADAAKMAEMHRDALLEKLDAVQDCDRCDALQAKLDAVVSAVNHWWAGIEDAVTSMSMIAKIIE